MDENLINRVVDLSNLMLVFFKEFFSQRGEDSIHVFSTVLVDYYVSLELNGFPNMVGMTP